MHEKNNEIGVNSPETLGLRKNENSFFQPENGPKWPEITFSEAAERIENYQDEWFQELKTWQERFANAKILFGGLPILIATWISFDYGLESAAITLLFLYLIVLMAYRRAKRWMAGKEIECYSNIKENIYVYSLHHPRDKKVNKRKREHEEKLEAANNQSDPRVIAIHFADHTHPNEQWDVDWPGRLLEDVLEDRKNRHLELGTKDPEWYEKYVLKQE